MLNFLSFKVVIKSSQIVLTAIYSFALVLLREWNLVYYNLVPHQISGCTPPSGKAVFSSCHLFSTALPLTSSLFLVLFFEILKIGRFELDFRNRLSCTRGLRQANIKVSKPKKWDHPYGSDLSLWKHFCFRKLDFLWKN